MNRKNPINVLRMTRKGIVASLALSALFISSSVFAITWPATPTGEVDNGKIGDWADKTRSLMAPNALNGATAVGIGSSIITTDGSGRNTATVSTGLLLDVEGQVGATGYCDEDGANCTKASVIATLAAGGSTATAVQSDADPATNLTAASTGDVAYDSTDGELQVFDGANWVPVSNAEVDATAIALIGAQTYASNNYVVDGQTVTASIDALDSGLAAVAATGSTATAVQSDADPATNLTAASTGDAAYDSTDGELQVFDGANWVPVSNAEVDATAIALIGAQTYASNNYVVDGQTVTASIDALDSGLAAVAATGSTATAVQSDADPATNLTAASTGDVAYDSTDGELQVFDGANWVPVSNAEVDATAIALIGAQTYASNNYVVDGQTVTASIDALDSGLAAVAATGSTATAVQSDADPATNLTAASTGDAAYDSTDGELQVFDGANWVPVSNAEVDATAIALIGAQTYASNNYVVDGQTVTASIDALDSGLAAVAATGSTATAVQSDADPATNLTAASTGDVAYDSTDGELQVFDGANWVPVSNAEVDATAIALIGAQTYASNNYVVDGQTVTASIDALDSGLAAVAAGGSTATAVQSDADPATNLTAASTGDAAYDSTDGELQVFDGANWVPVSNAEVDATAIALIGAQTYASNNYVVDGQTVTASIDALDSGLAAVAATGSTATAVQSNADPATNLTAASTGDAAYDSTDGELQVFDGANWVPVSNAEVDATAIALIGAQTYASNNYVVDGQTVTASIEALDQQIKLNADSIVSSAGGKFVDGANRADAIYTAGNVGIGITAPKEALEVNGNILATGTITPSDVNLKENIQALPNALDKVTNLLGVTYDWKDNRVEGSQLGVLAQNVETQYPQAVITLNDGTKAVNYSVLVAPLIEAVKELSIQNEVLEARIEALEN